ncbi:MAG: helix-turn-helix domain-containing protein [Thermoplasmata archaeon]|nr:helix-turn-helix domain-containing protein [Thermoplasmata archaeon]
MMLQKFSNLSKMSKKDDFDCIDVIGCIFNLTQTDISVIELLKTDYGATALEIATMIGKDRSTAHRSLEKLVACGLGQKGRKTNETRGYSYVYTRISDRDLYLKAKSNIDMCYKKIEKALHQLKKS